MDGRGASRSIVVKFALRYGIDVHEFLASKEQAPKVFHFKKLAGDWCVVVMEEIDGKELTHPVERPALGNIQAVVENLRLKDFVHGDLRCQNILLLADKSIRVMDFDWAGNSGQVKYPHNLNMDNIWHNDVMEKFTQNIICSRFHCYPRLCLS